MLFKSFLFLLLSVFILYSQTKVEKIAIMGNSFFTDSELLSMMNLSVNAVFSYTQFELDVQNILKNYRSEGFIECTVENVKLEYSGDSSLVEISFNINEGERAFIGDINFEGNRIFSDSYLLEKSGIKYGDVLNDAELNRGIAEILNLYESRGYIFAAVSISSVEIYNDGNTPKIRVNILIRENEKIKIDEVVTTGNTTTRRNVIVREIFMGRNKTVSRDDLDEIRRRLENTGFFGKVENPKIIKYNNRTVLLIIVTEGATNRIDGILGYVPPSVNGESGYITGFADLSLKNLFGTGRSIETKFSKPQRLSQDLEIIYHEPWILGYPINTSFAFSQQIQDSIYVKRNFSFKAETMISTRLALSGILSAERIIPSTTSGIPFAIQDSRTISAGAEIKYDTRNYIYNPSSGFLYKTGYLIGQKKIYNTDRFPELTPYFTVQKITAAFDFYSSFFRRQTLLSGIRAVEIRSPRYQPSDLFRLGGLNTVRGYREGQFLVSRTAWLNLETRLSLSRRSFIFLFFDSAYYLTPDYGNVNKSEGFIYGYGLGLRIESPLGLIGVSYGLGRGDNITDGKIHFGLVNDF